MTLPPRPPRSRPSAVRVLGTVALAATVASGCGGPDPAPDPAPAGGSGPRMVQPGAPGEATRQVSPGEVGAAEEGPAHSPADVRFMQGMIPHHAQALAMTALVREHATSEAIRQMALRMEISQRDEIALMARWLRDRGEEVPDWTVWATPPDPDAGGAGAHARHGEAHAHAGGRMPGMLSPEEMRELAAARGEAFDRLFLESMIRHHEGAIGMVAELFGTPGGGQASFVFQLATEIDADQRMEIDRMRALLSPEP